MTEALLEHGAKMMEERPLHAARRRQAPLHGVEPRFGRRVVALVDERGRFGMIDVEQVRFEPVALRDRARLAP